MNESQTRLEKITPALQKAGWEIGGNGNSRIITEYRITKGRISKSVKAKPLIADYILTYQNVKLAVVEAKSDERDYSDGVQQATEYALKLDIRFAYATNGDEIYEIDTLYPSNNRLIDSYPSPDELWERVYSKKDDWRDRFNEQHFYSDGTREPRYYQEIAINRALKAIADGKKRLLLTLATGTGKTFIAFQICYKLFQCKWNVKRTGNRPRILFLTDRNILANQAYLAFNGFSKDALVRITPDSVRKNEKVPTNGSVFFTIFQTFQCESNGEANFGQYPKDFFDLIVIDECHRGGANDESNWRKIMEYFEPAVQLGLTATPRRDVNADTYKYFCSETDGKPIYEYSLKEGINDGFLTPFRHVKMVSNIDDYIYSPEDEIISGEVEENKVYKEKDFYNGNIEIRKRDLARVKEFVQYVGEDKTLVFCYTQNHAAHVRDMINAIHGGNSEFAARVTADDGAKGEEYLKDFQDNEKTIPTVLTTSEKLSTGVDALNVRNIVLMRPINSMVEFKQIIGRGTRLYDGKYYFTIYDFVKAYEKFQDPSWDGEPVCSRCGNNPCTCNLKKYPTSEEDFVDNIKEPQPCYKCGNDPCTCQKPEKLEIRLSDKHFRKIRFVKDDMFWGADGRPVSAESFIKEMFGKLPEFFTSKEDLQKQWSNPETRDALLAKLEIAGYGKETLKNISQVIAAENSDLLDVLEYIAYNTTPIEREERAERARQYADSLGTAQKAFVEYMIDAYVQSGIDELEMDRLPKLLTLKFGSVPQGINAIGNLMAAKETFLEFQRRLYA